MKRRKEAVAACALTLPLLFGCGPSISLTPVTVRSMNPAAGSEPVVLAEEGSLTRVRNNLPIHVTALVVSRDTDGRVRSAREVLLHPESQETMPHAGGSTTIERMEPIHSALPLRSSALSCAPGGDGRSHGTTLREVETAFERLDITDSFEALELISLAHDRYSLSLQQWRTRREQERSERIYAELLGQVPPEPASQSASVDTEDLVGTALTMMAAYAEVERVRRGVFERQVELYRPVVENTERVLQELKEDLAEARTLVDRGARFQRLTHDAQASLLSAEAERHTADPAASLRITRSAARVCDRPAGLLDRAVIVAWARPEAKVLLGEVRFDRGPAQKAVFRRVGYTWNWVTSFYWPVEAIEARLRVRPDAAATWQNVPGALGSGRPSLERSVQDTEKLLDRLRDKYKEAVFAAQGGHNARTIIVP